MIPIVPVLPNVQRASEIEEERLLQETHGGEFWGKPCRLRMCWGVLSSEEAFSSLPVGLLRRDTWPSHGWLCSGCLPWRFRVRTACASRSCFETRARCPPRGSVVLLPALATGSRPTRQFYVWERLEERGACFSVDGFNRVDVLIEYCSWAVHGEIRCPVVLFVMQSPVSDGAGVCRLHQSRVPRL